LIWWGEEEEEEERVSCMGMESTFICSPSLGFSKARFCSTFNCTPKAAVTVNHCCQVAEISPHNSKRPNKFLIFFVLLVWLLAGGLLMVDPTTD
jgi:hypothetical protein